MVKHLAISGELGTGKSTVAHLIGERLGLRVFSTGEFQRAMARAEGLSTLQLNEKAMVRGDVDKLVDGEALRLATEAKDPVIFDSRMAWHTVPDCYRVRLVADPAVSAARAYSRGHVTERYSSVAEARENLGKRYSLEMARFADTYSVDITRLRNFDLVLDTSDLSPERVAELVIECWSANNRGPIVGISPMRTVPLVDYPDGEQLWRRGDLPIGYCRPYFFSFDAQYLIRVVSVATPPSVLFSSNLIVERDELGPTGRPACGMLDSYFSRDALPWLIRTGFALEAFASSLV